VVPGPSQDVVVPAPAPAPPKKDKSDASPTQGTVVVHLPKEAALYVDGTAVPYSTATRKIVTPELEPGRDYYYTLQAKLERDGKTLNVQKRVWVQAGKEVSVDFGDLGAASTAQR
jgi:uncharacterized protein (TIGR03000 family)